MKWPAWTGLGERTFRQPDGMVVQPSKTAWDWLQLLIVPAILVGAVTLYSGSQTAQQNRRSAQAAQDTTLDAYFLQMSNLMLHENLLRASRGSPVKAVADAITGAAISRLNTARQIEVATFISNARVPTANLAGAILTGADIPGAHFIYANLAGTNFDGADLVGANFEGADLLRAHFEGADLVSADLAAANLRLADLVGADLGGAYLRYANLHAAHLSGVRLSDANLRGVDLSDTDLRGADLRGANLSGAIFYNTTCPHGQVTFSRC